MWKSAKKIFAMEWILLRLSSVADLQQPINIGLQFFNDVLWYLLQIVLFETLYLHADQIGGWGLAEMRVFLGLIFVVDALQMIFFAHNFDVFSEKVVQRDLDLMLLRPVSTQQLMTCSKLQVGYLLNLVLGSCWLLWSLVMLPRGIQVSHLALLVLIIPCSLAIFYSTRLLFCTLALLMTRAEYFHEFYFTLFKLGQRPDRLYGPGLRYLVLLVVPVAMIASVPTRILVEDAFSWPLPSLIAGSISFVILSRLFWKWSVRRYMTVG